MIANTFCVSTFVVQGFLLLIFLCSSQSPVLEELVTDQDEISLSDIPYDVFLAVLHHIYSGNYLDSSLLRNFSDEMNFPVQLALIQAAERFKLPRLSSRLQRSTELVHGSNSFRTNLAKARKDKKFCDVILLTDQGNIACHKVTLQHENINII